MTSAYYASGSLLKQKNELLTGAGAAFPRWAIEKLDLALCKESLDVGCGWGRFAVPLSQLAPDDLRMVEVDVSAGMVRTCRRHSGSVVSRLRLLWRTRSDCLLRHSHLTS